MVAVQHGPLDPLATSLVQRVRDVGMARDAQRRTAMAHGSALRIRGAALQAMIEAIAVLRERCPAPIAEWRVNPVLLATARTVISHMPAWHRDHQAARVPDDLQIADDKFVVENDCREGDEPLVVWMRRREADFDVGDDHEAPQFYTRPPCRPNASTSCR